MPIFQTSDPYNQKPIKIQITEKTEALSGPTCLAFWPILVRGPSPKKRMPWGKILGELSRKDDGFISGLFGGWEALEIGFEATHDPFKKGEVGG